MNNNSKAKIGIKSKRSFLFIGLTISCSITLAALEWRTFSTEKSFFAGIVDTQIFGTDDEPGPAEFTIKERTVRAKKSTYIQPSPEIEIVKEEVEVKTEVDEFDFEEIGEEGEPVDPDITGTENAIEFKVTIPINQVEYLPYFMECGELKTKSEQYQCTNYHIQKLLNRSIVYPRRPVAMGIQGRVKVSFVVKKDGNIEEVKVVRSVHPELDAEAIRVVKNLPDMMPGRMGSIPVNVRMEIPIVFKLE